MTALAAGGTRSAVPLFRSEVERIGEGWAGVERDLARLSRQLEAHAERATYPQFADSLRHIAGSLAGDVRRVAERMAQLGRRAEINGAAPLAEGRSTWDRLRLSLEDVRVLLRQLGQLLVRWDDEHPAEAALVRDVRARLSGHRAALGDLLARSDPHALD